MVAHFESEKLDQTGPANSILAQRLSLPAKNIWMLWSNLGPAEIEILASWECVTLGTKVNEILQYSVA